VVAFFILPNISKSSIPYIGACVSKQKAECRLKTPGREQIKDASPNEIRGVTRMIKKKVLLTAMSSVMTLGLLSACGVDDNNLNNDDDVNYRPVRYNQNDDNGILDNDNNRNRGNGIFNNDNDDRDNNIFDIDRDNRNNNILDNDRNDRDNNIFNDDNDDNDLDLDLNDDDNNNDRNGLGGNNGNMTGRNR